jgi:Rhodopirellula transposase DDE domain
VESHRTPPLRLYHPELARKPLVTLAAIVQLIAATTTRSGLAVPCTLDANSYPNAVVVTDIELAVVNSTPDAFHSEWNYTITP